MAQQETIFQNKYNSKQEQRNLLTQLLIHRSQQPYYQVPMQHNQQLPYFKHLLTTKNILPDSCSTKQTSNECQTPPPTQTIKPPIKRKTTSENNLEEKDQNKKIKTQPKT